MGQLGTQQFALYQDELRENLALAATLGDYNR